MQEDEAKQTEELKDIEQGPQGTEDSRVRYMSPCCDLPTLLCPKVIEIFLSFGIACTAA